MTVDAELIEMILRNAIRKWEHPGGIGGQMMTGWTCPGCGKDEVHANTVHPSICKACAIILRHCVPGIARMLSAELETICNE